MPRSKSVRPRAPVVVIGPGGRMTLRPGPNRQIKSRRQCKTRPQRKNTPSPPILTAVADDPLCESDPVLAQALSHAMVSHVTKGVASSYNTAATQFANFCQIRNIQPWSASDITIAAWILLLCHVITSSSLRVYISGVRNEYINQSGSWPHEKSENLRRVLRYCKRTYPCAKKPASYLYVWLR